jgi:hypothetical protein
MAIVWGSVKREHVIRAIEAFQHENPNFPEPRNTFLVYSGKKYPAKHIRGMAYEIATGDQIDKNKFTGGMETASFLRRLGFEVLRTPTEGNSRMKQGRAVQSKPSGTVLDVNIQKSALQKLLQKCFGLMQAEKQFDWLKTPSIDALPSEYQKIYQALVNYRGFKNFFRSGFKLACDFFFENEKLIFEYDERQHFSYARKVTLENYPEYIELGFSKDDWIKECEIIRASDKTPKDRDESRAFYDSVRDIEAYRHGYRLIRIKHGEFNWGKLGAEKHLARLIKLPRSIMSAKKPELVRDKKQMPPNIKWREMEIEFQRIKLCYIKWLFYFTPPSQDYQVFFSNNGHAFTLSPCGFGYIFQGGKSINPVEKAFHGPAELKRETYEIRNSLSDRSSRLREILQSWLNDDQQSLVWDGLQNYFWIKLGLHEYALDIKYKLGLRRKVNGKAVYQPQEFSTKELGGGLREFIIASMQNGIDISCQVYRRFEKSEIEKLLRWHFYWNKYACCSYDCGPIAWGKNGFVNYSDVAAHRHSYDAVNYDRYNEMMAEGIAKVDLKKDRRAYAVDALSDLYDFALQYHLMPVSGEGRYWEFSQNKRWFYDMVERIQSRINEIIRTENLELSSFHLLPES